jgi:hypothetical protein
MATETRSYWSEPSPAWKARAAELTAQLTKLEPASGCVEGPGHVIGSLMALFGYKAKNYSGKTRIYLTHAKWVLLGLASSKTPAPTAKEVLGL